MNNEIYRMKGAEDALDWVCSLDDSKGHMLELSMVRNAAHSRSVELFPNENNVSTAQKEYESAFIERALSLVSALFTIDSKTTALHDKRKEFKVAGHICAIKWFMTVGKPFAKKFVGEKLNSVADRYYGIKYGRAKDKELESIFVDAFTEEATILIENY